MGCERGEDLLGSGDRSLSLLQLEKEVLDRLDPLRVAPGPRPLCGSEGRDGSRWCGVSEDAQGPGKAVLSSWKTPGLHTRVMKWWSIMRMEISATIGELDFHDPR